MVIIIPRITDSTQRPDLRDFVETVLAKWFQLPFSAHPRIVSYRILSVTDRQGVTLRHGLVTVTPDDAAARVIRKLNGKSLKGKRVGVKRYDMTAKQAVYQQA
jgi:hypothetical protein